MTSLWPCRFVVALDFQLHLVCFGEKFQKIHDSLNSLSPWQVSHKFSLIYVITKLGLLFVYDLETASAIYRNRISPDPIFLTSEASSVGGFYAINRRGQVLLATVNEATIIPFISGQVCSFFLFSQFKLPVSPCHSKKSMLLYHS